MLENVQKELSKFAKSVVRQSKKNLRSSGKSSSGKLENSINYDLKVHKQSFSIDFIMEKYGMFQDQGVSGTEQKYKTPFSYKKGIENRPSPKHFDKWVIKRGLAPRKIGGQFAKRSAIKFALATHIQKQGIKPSYFFTKPFEKAFKRLPNDVLDAFQLDLNKLLDFSTKDILK